MGNGRKSLSNFPGSGSQLKLGGRQAIRYPESRWPQEKKERKGNPDKDVGGKEDFPTFNKTLVQGPAMPRKKPSHTTAWKVLDQGGEWGLKFSLQCPYQAVCHGAALCLVSKMCIFFLIHTKASCKLSVALTKKSLSQDWGIWIRPSDHSSVLWNSAVCWLLYDQKAVLYKHDGFMLSRFSLFPLKFFFPFPCYCWKVPFVELTKSTNAIRDFASFHIGTSFKRRNAPGGL